MKKPTMNFKNLDAAQLLQFAEEIHNKMTDNIDIFATPTPDLATLATATTAYRDAVTEAAFNDRRAISFRNDKRGELETVISDLAKYVEITARGNQTVILSAGFLPTKDSSPDAGVNPKVERLAVQAHGLGSLKIAAKVAPWKKARYYQFEYRKKEVGAEWNTILSPTATLDIENLEPFQEYEFRASYLGKSTTPVYSDVVSTFAL
ncbi:hypothetical protein [Parapedobacter sp. 2B3]|uniref:hypothetical protein n=1 Tax=Parapedobacter sp. 2B3 TaxID=3342381 RepID=UPI0035B5DF4C